MGQLGAGAGLGSQLLGKKRLFLVGCGGKEVFAFLGGFEGLWKLEYSLISLVKQSLLVP